MARSKLRKTVGDLRSEIASRFQDPGSASMLVGTTCNFAFAGQVFFSPAMRHTSALMLSYTDTAYLVGALVSLALLVLARRRKGLDLCIKALWIAAFAVQLSLVLYCFLYGASVVVPPELDWACGAVFGAYIPLATLSWLRVHGRCRVSVVVWNVMLSAVLGSFVMWVFTGLASVQLCACMGVLLLVATATLVTCLRTMVGGADRRIDGGEGSAPVRYPFSAVFLFSFAFVVAISFAELGGSEASFTAGAFFAPFLFACALLLSLKDFSTLALLNIAVPVVAAATIAASFLRVDPVISFDLAVLGVFLFLVYTVILLCAGAQGSDRKATIAFLRIMIAFSGGCIAGRLGTAVCALLSGSVRPEAMVLLSVLAGIGAMVLCIRKGIMPKQLGELFHYSEGDGSGALTTTQRIWVDRLAVERSLGNREKEVLVLLLQKRSASEVAAELVIANGTAKSHIRHLYRKVDVHSRAELFDLFGIEHD